MRKIKSTALTLTLLAVLSTVNPTSALDPQGTWETRSGDIVGIRESDGYLEVDFKGQRCLGQWVEPEQSFRFFVPEQGYMNASFSGQNLLAVDQGWMGSDQFQRLSNEAPPNNKESRGIKQKYPQINPPLLGRTSRNDAQIGPPLLDTHPKGVSLDGKWGCEQFPNVTIHSVEAGRIVMEISATQGSVENMRGVWIQHSPTRRFSLMTSVLNKQGVSHLQCELEDDNTIRAKMGDESFVLIRDNALE